MARKRYSHDERKRIASRISVLTSHEDCSAIYDIISKDESIPLSENGDGVYLDMASVSDRTIGRISRYLKKVADRDSKKADQGEESDEEFVIPAAVVSKAKRPYKRSNYEQNILKHRMRSME
jgi:hypothetical protein